MKQLLLSLVVALTCVSAGAAPLLRTPQRIPFGIQIIETLQQADFNSDGHDDLLLVGEHSVEVLLANGTGPFAAPIVTPIETGALHFISGNLTGDFNGDGKQDVVITDRDAELVITLLGNGDGTFTTGPSLNTPGSPWKLAGGDFDDDGKTDLAIATVAATNDVRVYFGNGSGSFSGSDASILSTPSIPWLITPDMNGDGKSDLVAGSNVTTILLSNGDGTFTQTDDIPAGGNAVSADFNHDGKADLAADAGSSMTDVLFGNGDGTVTEGASYACLHTPTSQKAVDVDGDGNLDIVSISPLGDAVSVLRGNADGTFQPSTFWLGGNDPLNLAVSDFDRDGNVDLVFSDLEVPVNEMKDFLWFIRGNGDGTFQGDRVFRPNPGASLDWAQGARGFVTADLNHDGDPDAVIVQQKSTYPSSIDLGVMLNDGTGKLGAPALTTLTSTSTLALGDVNHDGELDAVLPDAGKTFLGNGDGTFDPPVSFTAQSVTAGMYPLLADFDGDDDPDLLAGSTLRLGNGDGTFGTPSVIEADGEVRLIAGDINGDGDLDAVARAFSGSATYAYINDGSAHFTRSTITTDTATFAALADFNGDDKLDLLFTTATGVKVRLGNGDGTFGAALFEEIYPRPWASTSEPPITADFDADGNLDIAFGTTILTGDGQGGFASRARRVAGDVRLLNAADMDGNGSPDLVCIGFLDNVEAILTKTAPDPTATTSLALQVVPDPPAYGGNGAYLVTVTPSGTIPLTGVVRYTLDGRNTGLIALFDDSHGQMNEMFTVGPHTIVATYTGDQFHQTSTASVPYTAIKGTPALTLSTNPSSNIVAGSNVTLHLVANRSSFPSNTEDPVFPGTVSFYENSVLLGTITLANNIADLQTTFSLGTHTVEAQYSGDANWFAATTSVTFTVDTVAAGTAPVLVATANGGTINLAWSKVAGATAYTLSYREHLADGWTTWLDHTTASSTSITPGANKTWQLAVVAYDANGAGPTSTPDLATTTTFTDPALTAHITKVKAQHILDLRTAIQSLRTFAGLTAYSYTNAAAAGQRIRAADVSELRTAMAQARTTIGIPAITFTDPTLVAQSTKVKAVHILELRAATN